MGYNQKENETKHYSEKKLEKNKIRILCSGYFSRSFCDF
jgi:hypothetical protein